MHRAAGVRAWRVNGDGAPAAAFSLSTTPAVTPRTAHCPGRLLIGKDKQDVRRRHGRMIVRMPICDKMCYVWISILDRFHELPLSCRQWANPRAM